MAENIFSTFDISSQGMRAQRMRLAAVARNIANVNTTKGSDGEPYKREITTIKAVDSGSFGGELGQQILSMQSGNLNDRNSGNNVLSVETNFDNSEPRLVYDPSHPHADDKGYVKMPNINIVTEMVEMLSAQKAFEANASVVDSAKNIVRDALDI